MQFFGGKFYKCVDQDGELLSAELTPNKTSCQQQGYQWKNSNVNFDNALNGFLPLFQVATFEGWIEVMKDAVDATKVSLVLPYFNLLFSPKKPKQIFYQPLSRTF